MTLKEKVKELVEELINEGYLEDVDWESGRTNYGTIQSELEDIVGSIEDLAVSITEKLDHDFAVKCEPAYDREEEKEMDI